MRLLSFSGVFPHVAFFSFCLTSPSVSLFLQPLTRTLILPLIYNNNNELNNKCWLFLLFTSFIILSPQFLKWELVLFQSLFNLYSSFSWFPTPPMQDLCLKVCGSLSFSIYVVNLIELLFFLSMFLQVTQISSQWTRITRWNSFANCCFLNLIL